MFTFVNLRAKLNEYTLYEELINKMAYLYQKDMHDIEFFPTLWFLIDLQ